jgi:uncharacterized protein (DUF305 family)
MHKNLLSIAAVIALVPMAAQGQMSHGGHGTHAGHGTQMQQSAASTSPSTQAFEAANQKMHGEMTIQYTGDADKDFLSGMIPHHRGAVDMAAIVIEYGKNPKVRELAEQIIREQEKEIVLMQALLEELNR